MFIEQKKLPCADYVKENYPLDDNLILIKRQFDEEIKENFINRRRLTVICGPCSADDPEAMHEYLCRLKNEQEKRPELLIVARIYTSKPHSNGLGYKGTCFHENVNDDIDLERGVIRARRIMTDCLKIGLPVADELLYPELYSYFDDLVSYWFVGARSSEDAMHRSFASGLDVCCGVKNGTDGDILKVVDSLNAISNPSVFPYDGAQITTSGCKYAHIVLRGGKFGKEFSCNISLAHAHYAKECLRALGLNEFIIADLSHANSGKAAVKQMENARLVANNHDINGVIVESYLYGGIDSNAYGVSKTDECLSFDETVDVLDVLQQGFKQRK